VHQLSQEQGLLPADQTKQESGTISCPISARFCGTSSPAIACRLGPVESHHNVPIPASFSPSR
jgi:hypothetical protein